MAGDRAYADADGPDDAGHERHLRRLDAAPEPKAPAEPRSHEEYYEALRAADGRPAESAEPAEPADSGWDSVDAADRPPPEAIRVSDERRGHILDGDPDGNGGGHRHGTGKPGKTEFPASWDDEKIIANVLDVARRPDKPPVHQEWNNRWVVRGRRDDVEIVVVMKTDGHIWTAWPPPGSPGVVKNPKEL